MALKKILKRKKSMSKLWPFICVKVEKRLYLHFLKGLLHFQSLFEKDCF